MTELFFVTPKKVNENFTGIWAMFKLIRIHFYAEYDIEITKTKKLKVSNWNKGKYGRTILNSRVQFL